MEAVPFSVTMQLKKKKHYRKKTKVEKNKNTKEREHSTVILVSLYTRGVVGSNTVTMRYGHLGVVLQETAATHKRLAT